VQVVGYEPRDGDPATLLVAAEGAVGRERLAPGTDLSYGLGERHCAGTIDDDVHVACGRSGAPYCEEHADRWPCARCTGGCNLPLDSCREDHAVYLAAFAPTTFKVGVTRSWRLERRLREQGADRAAHLRTVKNGRIARRIEADLAGEVGDRVRVPTKIRDIHRQVDEAAWEDLLADHDPIETYAFAYDLAVTERPQAETILSGSVRGTKGRVLLLEVGASTYAVDLRDLIGHEVTEGGVDRDLQASLGAF